MPVSRGCPGSQIHDRRSRDAARPAPPPAADPATAARSELRTWPVQLHLLNPQSAMFAGADLLIAADCVPFAHASFHRDFVRGRVPVIFCPKLDHAADAYLEKLTAILSGHEVRSLTAVHMEVPCCSGTTALAREALARSGKAIPFRDVTISIQGDVLQEK